MRFRYATGVLLHLAIGVGAGVSAAAEVQWINPAGGLYFVTPPNPSNWSPVAFPIATDTAIFNLGATYGVVFNAAPGKVGGVRVRQGGVSWLLGQQTLEVAPPSGPGVIVADTPGLAASLTLSGVGTVDGDYTQVAGPAGAVGTLNVVNAAHLKTTDLEVGVSGNGLLQIGPGSKVTSTSAEIGVHASGVGAATISGAGALWHVTDQNLIVGPAGHGDLAILNGGEVRVGDTPAGILNFASMWIGHGSATEVTALVAGAGSKLYTTGELRLAYVGPSSARLDVKSGGVVQSVWNGDFGRGSKATVVVQDPGSKLILGNTLELAGVGTSVSIVNGATGSASGLDIATLSGNDAALLLNGVGSKFSTQFESFVGHVGTGQVYVEGGAHL